MRLELRKDLKLEQEDTFAAPLVGNVALREQLASSGAGQPMRNMYHFVLDTDIVPSGKSSPVVFPTLLQY